VETLLTKASTKYNVFLDDGGIMLTPSAIEDLQAALTAHLAHSPLELEAIGSKIVKNSIHTWCPSSTKTGLRSDRTLAQYSGTGHGFAINCKNHSRFSRSFRPR
jgi:hypothetical protein